MVEELRTARRFLSRYGLRGHIDELDFHVLNEHTTPAEVEAMLPLFDGQDVGLMSEAGLPAVADPGAALVALCHRHGIEVVPLVGPSSLMLALMGRVLRGPRFTDRIVAVNAINTLVTASICILSRRLRAAYLLDVALIYALLGFTAVVLLTRLLAAGRKEGDRK